MKRAGRAHESDDPTQEQITDPDKPRPDHEPLVEAKDVAKYLGVKESWLKNQVRSRIPKERQIPHYKLGEGKGTYLRFRFSRIDVWFEAREQGFRCLTR